MKYFSEKSGKMQDTVEELEKAEAELAVKKNERKEAAGKVENAYAAMKEAKVAYEKASQAYHDELVDFCNKYGTYKKTLKATDVFELDPFFKFFNF